ncbi:hypothetical protein Acr_04g0007240 [Actinidia rufa]|uniref:Uncharacterized protein n=1 Tax=Actinidia rufa TaxID=165716 RepID=A0A7J0EIG2_9ERIC|nr:hypothetical protein Acr_04g0007240 [Actinidia rufa]
MMFVQIFKGHRCQLRSGLAICARNHPTSRTYSARIPTIAQFRELPKVMTHINNIREKLRDIIPRSVKDFPLKKPEDILLRQLLLVGKEALKWSLLALFVFSSVSDVIYCISKNKELMIPFGLFVGYGVTNFLMETSQELFPTTEVCCFIVLYYAVVESKDTLFCRKEACRGIFWALGAFSLLLR